jgi:cytochrome c biogenesis protein CcdA
MTPALILVVVGIAVFDSLNPSLFLGQFYLMTTANPLRRIWSYIAGLLTVNYLGGVLFLSGFSVLLGRFFAQLDLDLVLWLLLALGIGLVFFGLQLRVTPAQLPKREVLVRDARGGILGSFGLGALIMLNELTTALPYLAAIERIAAADLTWAGNLLMLAVYNLIFGLPLLLFLALFVKMRGRFTAQIARISAAVHLWTLRIFKYGSLAGGALLAVWAGLRLRDLV